MRRVLSGAAAGITAALLAGALAGVFLFVYTLSAGKGAGPGANLTVEIGYSVYVGALLFGSLGVLPGVLLTCLSSLKRRPWRSLSRFVPLSAIGGFILCFPWSLRPSSDFNTVVGAALYIAGFTIGGLVAAWIVSREARRAARPRSA